MAYVKRIWPIFLSPFSEANEEHSSCLVGPSTTAKHFDSARSLALRCILDLQNNCSMSKPAKPTSLSYPIEQRIHLLRGQKVMLDADLAALYDVETRALTQAIKRNADRFPSTFMFQLSAEEAAHMRSQFVIASKRNVRYQPLAFTEHGVVMLSAVLSSPLAVQMSIMVVQAFVRLREMIAANKDLADRVGKLEAHQRNIGSIIDVLVDEIENMKAPPPPSKRKFGFDL